MIFYLYAPISDENFTSLKIDSFGDEKLGGNIYSHRLNKRKIL